ncbi:MAG TPA: putative glycolipid-binding domain-containing protein [Thermoanaerobaculia bacterium]
MADDAILWERLDTPGHDACRLERRGSEWQLSGTAAFAAGSVPTCLHYAVACDSQWRTIEGSVSGWSGSQAVAVRFRRTSGGSWTMNDRATDALADCIDLDFGFTPATNILQLRRLSLGIGDRADVPVAWFDLEADGLQRLPQTYHRISGHAYGYVSPSAGYAAELEVNAFGFVRIYPGLWQQVP